MIDWEAFKRQIQSNPTQMLGFVLGIAVCFLLIWMLVVLQTDTTGETVAVDQNGRLDSLRISLNQPITDSLGLVEQQSPSRPAEEESSSPLGNALPIFLILMSVIGGLWYWIKKGNTSPGGSTNTSRSLFITIGTQQLTAAHQITVISINGEYWVMSSNEQELQLLHRFSKEEWNGPDSPYESKESANSNLFAKILKTKQGKEPTGSNGSSD